MFNPVNASSVRATHSVQAGNVLAATWSEGRAHDAQLVRLDRALVRVPVHVEKASVLRMDRPVEACEWRR